jgi:hypothetical protein
MDADEVEDDEHAAATSIPASRAADARRAEARGRVRGRADDSAVTGAAPVG